MEKGVEESNGVMRLTVAEAEELIRLRGAVAILKGKLLQIEKIRTLPAVHKDGYKKPSRRNPMLNTTQIAYLLGVSRQRAWQFLSSGELRSSHALDVKEFLIARISGSRTAQQREERDKFMQERLERIRKQKRVKKSRRNPTIQ